VHLSAAYFVQSTVSAYEKHVGSSPRDQDEPGKEASNLIVLVSELYNFQVISCILIYDIVQDLLSQRQLSEYNIELLLKILRSKYLHSLSRGFTKLGKILGCSSDKMTHPH
jgi:nucleolar MIF4G domain-containing protein 1